MKYIFLFALLVSAQISSAQEGNSLTNPNFYSENQQRADQVRAFGDNPNSSGGEINNTDLSSGGEINNANLSSGGEINNGNLSSGGSLPELSKPNLTIVGITNWFVQVLNYIGVLLFAAALIMFLYGVFMLMFVHGASEESRSKGKKFMFWGIVSLFVMTSTWGLVNVLRTSIFGPSGGGNLILPQLK